MKRRPQSHSQRKLPHRAARTGSSGHNSEPGTSPERVRDGLVVHYLKYGMTACLVNGPPKDWPENHKWSSDWSEVTCGHCLSGRQLIHTYRISDDGKSITCLRCQRTSWNAGDVEHHYCGYCHAFHDDIWPPARLAWITGGQRKDNMIVARGGTDKEPLLLLGLSRVNIERLTTGQPIRVRREIHGDAVPEGWEVIICFGETELALADQLKRGGVIAEDATMKVDPRLKE